LPADDDENHPGLEGVETIMTNLDDLRIQRTPEPAVPQPTRSRGALWAIGALLVAALAAVYVLLIWNRDAGRPAGDTTAVATETVQAQPLGGTPENIELPPLDATDSLVREMLSALSSHPRLMGWLATDSLIRGFTVAVDTVAAGSTPAGQLPVLKPSGSFAVAEAGEDAVIDPASYARYDSLADGFASLDPAGLAKVYGTLKPRIEEAYRERFVGTSFDARLERAIIVLLQTPDVPADVAVEPRGIGYAFADPKLEGLSGAQKHLLRTGPRNVALVKSRLREIALALGIPAERLPGQK
jgi:hypothetical protein